MEKKIILTVLVFILATHLWLVLGGMPTVVGEGEHGLVHPSTKSPQWVRGNPHMEIRSVLPKERSVNVAVYHWKVQA